MERPTARRRASRPRVAAPLVLVSIVVSTTLMVLLGGSVCVLTHVLSTGRAPAPAAIAVLGVWLTLGGAVAGLVGVGRGRALRASPAVGVGALGLLGGQGLLALWSQPSPERACLPVMGRGARLGLELALLRDDPACPAHTLAPASAAGAAYALVCLAIGLIAVHAVTAVLLGILTAALLSVLLLGVRQLLACSHSVAVVVPAGPGLPVVVPPILRAGLIAASSARRRGPPLRTSVA